MMQLSRFYAKPAESVTPGKKKPLTVLYRHEKDSCRQVVKGGGGEVAGYNYF